MNIGGKTMITIADDIKLCSIVSSYYADQAYLESTATEHIRILIHDTLKTFVNFKESNDTPIRIASSIPMIKRLITKDKQIFRTITPFVMASVNETEDENIGALISPQNTSFKSDLYPYPLHTQAIYRRMKNYDISNNIEIRLGERTSNFTCAAIVYDDTRPLVNSYKKTWDWEITPGRMYQKEVQMKTIVPELIIGEYCNWCEHEIDFDWFIEEMNEKSASNFIFDKELDKGTGKWAVIMKYITIMKFRAASTLAPTPEEEGDEVRYWNVSRSFLFSFNIPTNFLFCRESDIRTPELGGTKENYLNDMIGHVSTSTASSTSINTYNLTTKLNIPNVYDGYTLIENYGLLDVDFDQIKNEDIKILEIDVKDSILTTDMEKECAFIEYCINKDLFNSKLDTPVKVVIKSDNIIIDTHSTIADATLLIRTNVTSKIYDDKNCNIYVYFDNKMYSEFLNIYKGPEVLHVDNMSIKQVMGR